MTALIAALALIVGFQLGAGWVIGDSRTRSADAAEASR